MIARGRVNPASPSLGGAGDEAWDELADAQGAVRPAWKHFSAKMQTWSPDERGALSNAAARMLDDLGTAFNVYSDVGTSGQPYQLDPVPLMVSHEEWTALSKGLAQRMRVLEAVVADLYGPRKLLTSGLIPPDLVHANPVFQPQTRGIQPVGGKFLITTACDLIRGPDGQWMVLRDQTRGPGGLGQVLENRNVISNLLSEEFKAVPIARLSPFFDQERVTLQGLCLPRAEVPNVVVLTPGFRHPSYFEHVYKSRLLGLQLVQAGDLTVRERRLFLKTLGGLRRIDGVACRTDEDGVDPLEFWTLGGGGVPGLVEAWRSGNVAIANAPGAGFAATAALLPFLPRICREWFGEDLLLPFLETWWLGQPEVRRRVLDQLHRYVLISAFRTEPHLPVRCSTLSPAARRQWAAAIEENPHEFVVQRDITPSHTPALDGRSLSSRPFVWRTFTLNAADGPISLPGGLARVGKVGQAPQLWPWHAGFTKDVWVEDDATAGQQRAAAREAKPELRRHPAASEVPSRIAEQLFWVGRYAERIELSTRLVRVTLRHSLGESGRRQRDHLAACLGLIDGSDLVREDEKMKAAELFRTLSELVHDGPGRRGISTLTRYLLSNAAAARDRLSDDTWRFFNRLEDIVRAPAAPPKPADLSQTLDSLILHLAAFAGMQAENMTRGQGWRFLEIGRRIERTVGGLSLLRAAAGFGDGESPVLEPLLETLDSVMTYRRRHFSRPRWDGVCDLLFRDPLNPRSVAFQISVLKRESGLLPGDHAIGLFPKIEARLAELESRVDGSDTPDAAELKAIGKSVQELSDFLTQHYFSHSVRRVY